MRTQRLLQLTAIAGVALWTGACATKTINHVLADPARYAHHAVTVRGEVVRSYSLLGLGAYELRDGTGQLWVVSHRGVPRQGTRVQVKGTVRDLIEAGPLIPRDVRVGAFIQESSRTVRD